MAGLPTVFQSCEPRPEVLRGELREDMFAARLRDVIEGTADPVYQDPVKFFENTFPTNGLRVLAEEVLGQLSGKRSGSPFIRLETSFGGGKTHNLIALYHLLHNRVPEDLVARVVDPGLLPTEAVRVAGVVGSDLDPANGLKHPDCTTFTLWGEIAYQLAGLEGYGLMEKSDREGSVPGVPLLKELVGNWPTLIMIDELADHLRVLKGYKAGLAGNLTSFLLHLLEVAGSPDCRVVVVLTLAGPGDAFRAETEEIQAALAEARSVSARKERIISPTTDEAEIASIVAHRLFRHIDREAASQVAQAFLQYYRGELERKTAEFPAHAARAEYAALIEQNYPFHPELLSTLHRKTSTIPNFQRTRGALRLLARTVRRLWEKRPADAHLIHPHHVDLEDEDTVQDLTSRLERPLFRQVVLADIVAPQKANPAHAQAIDREWVEAGRPSYALRAATAIFLHSITAGGPQAAAGVDPLSLRLAVLGPEDEAALLERALDRLVDNCWFLEWDGQRYRFKTEPSLNKIVADETQTVGRVQAKEELDRRIRRLWKKGVFEPKVFPAEPGEVEDDDGPPKLVVVHYEAEAVTPHDELPPGLVRTIFEHAGAAGGYRQYKNNLLFLVADRDQRERMIEVARRYLALQRIVEDPDRLAEFNQEQQNKLRGMGDQAELELRVAITRAYRHLFYPSSDAPEEAGYLSRHMLEPEQQGEVEKDQTQVLLRVLKQKLDKVITADSPPLAPEFLRARAWPGQQPAATTAELRRVFARRVGLKMLLDPQHLKQAVRDGVKQGIWIYYDADEDTGYGPNSPLPDVRIDDRCLVLLPAEAERRGLRLKGEPREAPTETCPVCGRPAPACVCGEEAGDEHPARRGPLTAEGTAAQAFQRLADVARERAATINRLALRLGGRGGEGVRELVALGAAVPQLGKGSFRLRLRLVLDLGNTESLKLDFDGTWDRYKRLKQAAETLAREASDAEVQVILQAEFPGALNPDEERYRNIAEVLGSLGLGRVVLEAYGDGAEEGS